MLAPLGPLVVLALLGPLVVLAFLRSGQAQTDPDLIFNLSNFTGKGTAIENISVLPPDSNFRIQILDIPPFVSFVVVQAHSFLYNVSMSYHPELRPSLHVNGTNIGLVYFINDPQTGSISLINSNIFNVTVMVVISAYTDKAPIPGGCNMEFPTHTAPYLNLNYNDALTVVEGQPAMAPEDVATNSCKVHNLRYKMYLLYLKERDFSQESYFSNLRLMLTPEDAIKSGHLVISLDRDPVLRDLFAAYRGTGSIFTLTVESLYTSHFDSVSAYVPIHSYACNNAYSTDSCQIFTSSFFKAFYVALLLMGLFLCFLARSCFIMEIFIMGTLFGGILSYIILLLEFEAVKDYIPEATAIGFLCGLFWVSIWIYKRSTLLSTLPVFILLGALLSSITFYAIGDYPIFKSAINYWLTFGTITLCSILILLLNPKHSNISCCSIIGGYATILPIDYYAGTNLKYIVSNVIHRATVDSFNLATTYPPFQMPDIILSVVWLSLALIGLKTQSVIAKAKQRARPTPGLLTPLLSDSYHSPQGSDNVFYA